MPAWARSVLAVLAGIITGVVVVTIVDVLVGAIHPLPEGTDLRDRAQVAAAMGGMPTSAFVLLLVGWVVAAFAATFVAARIATRRHAVHGYVAGMVLFASTLLNLFMVPHPAWMLPVTCALVPVNVWLATRVAAPRTPVAPAAA